MIRSHTLRKRDLYLDKLIAFQDTEPIKVVTGIRRCGKSSLLKLMAAHLRGNGVSDEQIIEMNFESYEFLKMTADELYRYVKERVLPDRRIYLFFDELQRMDGWENAVNSFRVDFDCDIYITVEIHAELVDGDIYILPARMPICFPLSIRPIYPDDVWKSRCCRCPLRSSLIFTALRLRRSRAHLAAKRRKRSIKMVRNTNCVRFLTRTCVLAVCPVLPTSAWNRIRR